MTNRVAQMSRKIPARTKPKKSSFRSLMSRAFLGLLFVMWAEAATAQINATVEAFEENGFGRLVFDFAQMPKTKHRVSGTVLVLDFANPVKIDLRPVSKGAARYISVARQDPDGRAIRFALTAPFKVNVIEAGTQLYLDILPSNWVGLPPTLPEEVIQRLARVSQEEAKRRAEEERQLSLARAGYELKVRTGEYKTFSRIVFDWNKFVVAGISRDQSRLTVKFSVRADPDLSRIKATPPKWLRRIDKKNILGGMEFNLVVDPSANVRGFREGFSYVVDLSPPEHGINQSAQKTLEDAQAKSAAQQTPPPGPREIMELGADVNQQPKPAEELPAAKEQSSTQPPAASGWQTDLSVNEAPVPPRETPVPQEQAKEEKKSADVTSPEAIKPDAPPSNYAKAESEYNDETPTPETIAQAPEPQGQTKPKQSKPEEKAELSPPTENSTTTPIPAQKAEAAPKSKLKTPNPPEQVAKKAEPKPTVQAKKEAVATARQKPKNDKNAEFTFSFSQPTAAAIFRRGNIVWAVFDTTDPVDVQGVRQNYPWLIEDAEVSDISDAKLVRLKLSKTSLVSAEQSGNDWNIAIGELVADKSTPLSLYRGKVTGGGAYVSINLEQASRVHWISDPLLGDQLGVVTAQGPPKSTTKPYKFVEFRALTTAHGLALKSSIDDLSIRTRNRDVLVSRARGLNISSLKDRPKVFNKRVKDKSQRAGFIDFDNWQRGGAPRFNSELAKLEREITTVKDTKRNAARIEMARFFLSHRLAPEVLGTLRLVTGDSPRANTDPKVKVLRGAANTMMGRYMEANEDLDAKVLDQDVDAALWRGVNRLKQEKWKEALDNFTAGDVVIKDYPADLQAKFRLAAAEAALEKKLWSRAADELGKLPSADLPRPLVANAELVRGRYYEELGKSKLAKAAYANALAEGNPEAVAKARLQLISLNYKLKALELDQAIEDLESLTISWRGDDTELRALRLLTGLYSNTGRYRQAFETMKNAIKTFPDEDIALQIQDDMKKVFQEIFLQDKSRQLPVTAAIGLYYDYRELTPPGRLGDTMIRKLAEKLISVDLLDQATELLDHQVKNRLRGAAKAQVAVKLAMVQLMNGKPQLALGTLRRTRQPNIPAATQRARDVLEARALGELGRATNAIDLLSRLEGRDIDRLRGDVLWNAQKWAPAGEQFEKMLGTKWQDEEELSENERFDVLRAAISYSLAEDRFALNRLRKKFYKKMSQSKDADAFVLVTQPLQAKSEQFDELVKEIASSSTLDAFMKSFEERFNPAPAPPQEADQTDQRPFG